MTCSSTIASLNRSRPWIRASRSEESSFFVRLSRERAGGRERGRETVREIGRTIRAEAIGGVVVPEKTIRQFSTSDLRHSPATEPYSPSFLRRSIQINADPSIQARSTTWVLDPASSLRASYACDRHPARRRSRVADAAAGVACGGAPYADETGRGCPARRGLGSALAAVEAVRDVAYATVVERLATSSACRR